MSGGVLEVLLVSAEGLKHARLIGSSSQYVVIECGTHTSVTKFTGDEDGKTWWNEKVSFSLSSMEMKSLFKMKLSIMERSNITEDCPIGEATIHLLDFLREATGQGSVEVKPAPYKVVLKDKTYKGEIKVGLKFISGGESQVQCGNMVYGFHAKQSWCFLWEAILNCTLRRIYRKRPFGYCARGRQESKKEK
ncbi:hypothetical protein HPP92_005037 [Vanilla planifolia]|uniref:C2 domain-containing protein n=1 Tax=Vanilla planifolia TaxID=51239 RepID=A0A835RM84_VANPL|nr:hypothetical protein HPP92_005037 [Vanilla planifolia]